MKQTLSEMEEKAAKERDKKAPCSEDQVQKTVTPSGGEQQANQKQALRLTLRDSGFMDVSFDCDDDKLENITEDLENEIHYGQAPKCILTSKPFNKHPQELESTPLVSPPTDIQPSYQETSYGPQTAVAVHNKLSAFRRGSNALSTLYNLQGDIAQLEASNYALQEKIRNLECDLEDTKKKLQLKETEIVSLDKEIVRLNQERDYHLSQLSKKEKITQLKDEESKAKKTSKNDVGANKVDQILIEIQKMRADIKHKERERETLLETMKQKEQLLKARNEELQAKILQQKQLTHDQDNKVKDLTKQVSLEKRNRLAAEGYTSICTGLCVTLVLVIVIMFFEVINQREQGDTNYCWLNPGGNKYPFL